MGFNSPFKGLKISNTYQSRRNVGESSCNSGDGTDQRVQSLIFIMMMTYQSLFNLGYTKQKAARPRLHGKSTYEHPRWFPLSTIQIKHGELKRIRFGPNGAC